MALGQHHMARMLWVPAFAGMALTARVLHLGVPIVTAFHVARMLVVVTTIGPLYRWSTRRVIGSS